MKVLTALSVVTAVFLGFSEGAFALEDAQLDIAAENLGKGGVLVHEYMSCLEDGDMDGLKKALEEIRKSNIRSLILISSELLEAALKRKTYKDFSTLTFARDLKIQLDILSEKYDTLLGILVVPTPLLSPATQVKPFKPSNVPAPFQHIFWSGPAKVAADKIYGAPTLPNRFAPLLYPFLPIHSDVGPLDPNPERPSDPRPFPLDPRPSRPHVKPSGEAIPRLPTPIVDHSQDSPSKRPIAHLLHNELKTGHGGSSLKPSPDKIHKPHTPPEVSSPTKKLKAGKRRNADSAGKKPTF